jgi:hypothetical protein
MKDTLPYIKKLQLEIMLSKSISERFRIGDELNTFGRKVLENSILLEHPEISDVELKIKVFRRCYSTFYSPDELDKIVLALRNYWQRQ